MKTFAVIMAGGRGERFWPASRNNFPKQFLTLTDDGKTMLQLTVERIAPLVGLENIMIVTNRDYRELVREQTSIPEENIVLEPHARNTAPCIALAAAVIEKRHGQANMVVLPADHLIRSGDFFRNVVKDALAAATTQSASIITIGIPPAYPETGYGYINFDFNSKIENGFYMVKKFVEKPNFERAKEYVEDGSFLWNSGIFVFTTQTILNNIATHEPTMYASILRIQTAVDTENASEILENEYRTIKSISIDNGVLERTTDIYVAIGNFGWDDVGSWNSLDKFNKTNEFGNVVRGNCVTIDVKNSILRVGEKLVALIGLENVVVVDTDDAMLICARDRVQDVKKIVENLKICNRPEI